VNGDAAHVEPSARLAITPRLLVGFARRRPLDTAFWALVAAFAAFHIWRTVASPIDVWQDTLAYISVSHSAWLSRALWAGARPPVTPVLWKLTRTTRAFTVVQTVLSVLSWSFLAWTVMRLIRPGWRSFAAAALVLVFATCWPVTMWDSSVLSESVSLSALAVLISSAIWLARRFSRGATAGLFASAIVLAGARDENVWTVAMIGAAIAASGLLHLVRTKQRHIARVVVIGLALVATASGIGAAALSSGRNLVNVENVFAVRIFPYSGRVAWFAAHGMPEAAAIDRLARTTHTARGDAPLVYPDLETRPWLALEGYFSERSEWSYVVFLATHPGYDITAPFVRPQLAFDDANGNLGYYGARARELPGVSSVLFPEWGVVLVIALLGAALTVVRRLWRRREALLAAGLALVGLAAMLIAWHGDGQEIVRHMVEGEVQARFAALLIFLIGVFGVAPSRAGAPAAGAD
jgi:hypothetical protein